MRKRFSGSMITVAVAGAAVSAGIAVPITRTLAQARCFPPPRQPQRGLCQSFCRL